MHYNKKTEFVLKKAALNSLHSRLARNLSTTDLVIRKPFWYRQDEEGTSGVLNKLETNKAKLEQDIDILEREIGDTLQA